MIAAALALCACTAHSSPPPRPFTAGPQIRLRTTSVALVATRVAENRVGAFLYAGGLELTSADTERLHGLSDLEVTPDGRLTAVSDDGDLFEARLVLDGKERLIGLAGATLSPLTGEDGQPLSASGKREADAEGLATLADGTRLVSFERDHRILAYPAPGGPPRRAPSPAGPFPDNAGLEALGPFPAAGPDAYLAGVEESGQISLCRPASGCTPDASVSLPDEAGLVAVAALPDGRRAYLLRAFSVLQGVRVTLRIVDPAGATLDELRLASPLTVDNFEGLAALPRADGSIRFYLLSDDNFSKLQRTLLVAFDWQPQKGRVQ